MRRATFVRVHRSGLGTVQLPPVITSGGVLSVSEGVGLSHVLTANVSVDWTIRPGLDASAFSLGTVEGQPVLILPGPAADGVYGVTVRATRPQDPSLYDEQTLAVTVIPLTITSPATASGPAASSLAVTLTANEPVTWSVSGGADAGSVTLDGAVLTLPSGTVRAYAVQVQAQSTDTLRTETQNITLTLTASGSVDLVQILPGPLWDGTEAGGWEGAPPALITRTGPQAIGKTVQLDELAMLGTDIWIGGRFDAKGGVDKVEALCAGATYDLGAQRVHTYPDPRGGADKIVIGHFGNLSRTGMPAVYGVFTLYYRVTPTDPAILPFVLGPFKYYHPSTAPGTHSIYDASTNPAGKYGRIIEFGTGVTDVVGVRYNTWLKAAKYARDNGLRNAILLCTVTGNYNCRSGTTTIGSNAVGCRIVTTHAPGIVATFTNLGSPADVNYNRWRTGYNGLHFLGSGIVFDQLNIEQIYHESTGLQISEAFEGVEIMNSMGAGALLNGLTAPYNFAGSGLYLDCYIHHIRADRFANAVKLARNNFMEYCSGDVFALGNCVVGNRVENQDQQPYRISTPALDVSYVGAGAGTLARERSPTYSGDPSTRNEKTDLIVLRVDDVVVGTIPMLGTMLALADGINAIAGFVAVSLHNTGYTSVDERAAKVLTNGNRGMPWSPAALTSTPLNFITTFDVHGDFYQASTSVRINIVFAENTGYANEVQTWFFTGSGHQKDVLIENNAFEAIGGMSSQTSVPLSHFIFRHNALSQSYLLRSGITVDAACEFANNILSSGGST